MFNINGEDWEVLLVEWDHPSLIRYDGSRTIGMCDDNVKTIYISNALDEQKLKKVLVHELTHAAMFSYNVTLTIEQEEIVADLIATYGQEIIDMTNKIFYRLSQKIKWER